MKRVKSVNGYTIYEATTQRDVDNYNCQIGSYNIYLSTDIRDFGLTNSYPEYDDVDSLTAALNICRDSKFAIACALADELSDSTVQDMDLCLEIERRFDAGESVEYVRDCYDPETGILHAEPSENPSYYTWLDSVRDQYIADCHAEDDGDLDDDDLDGDLDDDDLDGDLEDVLDAALSAGDRADDEAALRDWELSAVDVGDYMLDGYRAWKVTSKDHSSGEWRFTVESPIGESYCIDAESAGRARFIGEGSDWADKRRAAELWSGHEIASHATYYVVESEGDYYTISVRDAYDLSKNQRRYLFFRAVAERIAFSDCSYETVEEIVFDGCHIEYAGWQPGMLYEFRETGTGLIVFSERFPEWDH